MRKSKYEDKELVQDMIDAIAATGSHKVAYEEAGIHKSTFYAWLKEKKEFSDQVALAEQHYRRNRPRTQILQAQKAFEDYLYGRTCIEWSTTSTVQGIQGGKEVDYTTKSIKRHSAGTPKWAIERILGEPFDEFSAINKLIKAGWLPQWVLQAAREHTTEFRSGLREIFAGVLKDDGAGTRPLGISDEAAASIRQKILGVESENSSTVPAEMDTGSVSVQAGGEVTADRD